MKRPYKSHNFTRDDQPLQNSNFVAIYVIQWKNVCQQSQVLARKENRTGWQKIIFMCWGIFQQILIYIL